MTSSVINDNASSYTFNDLINALQATDEVTSSNAFNGFINGKTSSYAFNGFKFQDLTSSFL